MTGSVAVEQRGNVLIATLSNPPMAVMDSEIVVGLLALARRADADSDVGAVVLTGDHPTRFVAHFNVEEILSAAEQAPRCRSGCCVPDCGRQGRRCVCPAPPSS